MARQIQIREWTCPNHEYPVSLGREDGEHPWEALPKVAELLRSLPDTPEVEAARIEFGLCCEAAEWRTVGYRDASQWEEMLYAMAPPMTRGHL